MEVKVKKQNKDGIVRLESIGSVRDVRINEDFMHPEKESISICFRGKNSSGIVSLTPSEIENIYKAVKNKTHLIKGIKKFTARKDKAI